VKGLLAILPDGRYELKSFAADEERYNVIAYAVFAGTHTGEGGPVPPTGKPQRRTTSMSWTSRATVFATSRRSGIPG
jgi:predicted ester cyclase